MKSLVLALFLFASANAFAKEKLIPMDDTSVPAPMVYDIKPAYSQDEVINATLLTVFRGSAAGISAVIVTFADSLEDSMFSYEFNNVLDAPTGISLTKEADGTYLLKFDVSLSIVNEETGEFSSRPETIKLSVTKDSEGTYEVYRL